MSVLLLAACGRAATRTATVTSPAAVAPILEREVAAEPMPVRTRLQQGPVDPVGLAIVEARLRFERGEDLYDQGFLNQAKTEFDAALNILLESSAVHPANERIQREIIDLTAQMHAFERIAFKDGDGFTEQPQEHAAIDDLKNIETFPNLVDPELRRRAEDELADAGHDLPIEINDRVLGFLDYYQKRGRTTIEVGHERMGKYRDMIERIMREEGVPLDLIYVAQAESAFLPRALSSAAAKGMWQFISSRGKEYGLRQTWWIDERSDPEKSTRAAARHMRDLFEDFGDWYLAMAAYNSGPARVRRAMARTGKSTFWELADRNALPRETINYVPTVLALTIIGKNPEKFGFTVAPSPALDVERVNVDKATDLRVIAEKLRLAVDDLRDLNPHVLRWTTPPDDADFELILPRGLKDTFELHVASLPESERVKFHEHFVRSGDTLSAIAAKYGTSVSALTEANNISVRKVLRIGQELIVPISGVMPSQVTSTAAPASAPATTTTAYTVRRGDTLSQIAARHRVTVTELKRWNSMSSNRIVAGQKLKITAATAAATAASDGNNRLVYQVRPGDTLIKIATTYKTTVNSILSWNKSNDLRVIHPGDRITIFLGDNQED